MRNLTLLLILVCLCAQHAIAKTDVRVSELGRFSTVRENPLIGYGLIVGLAGTGDSPRNAATVQSVANALQHFGLDTSQLEIKSRNVAAVIVTASLPAFAERGDMLDVKVSSIGDARSLTGGVLFMTPLRAADEKVYALAQGQVSVGGYAIDSFDSRVQKNHPTVGVISDGATIERTLLEELRTEDGKIEFVLNSPDFHTITAISDAINRELPMVNANPVHAGKLSVSVSETSPSAIVRTIAAINDIAVQPRVKSRVVVNERSGTIVAGGDVRIDAVTISHGEMRLRIETQYQVSQPFFIGRGTKSAETVVVPDTEISVDEPEVRSVELKSGATVAELVSALRSIQASTRDVIAILHSIKSAGALHAELIVE